jgi:hypothetical protein
MITATTTTTTTTTTIIMMIIHVTTIIHGQKPERVQATLSGSGSPEACFHVQPRLPSCWSVFR